ncbi:MAG: peptidyl-prolyl cis-trans isomerase [Gammaproteobacteria bacterium]|nr:peptidyl-prolyl cis-trans isomerase [Gammaproteobacteria bacterium]
MIKFTTNHGDILIDLNEEKAPVSCENFKQYVTDGHYDGTIFHRVIKGFMIQGGGFMPDMMQKATRDNIENEAKNGLSNKRGTLAMARTMEPHSASSQFFINVKDNDFLDYPGQDGWGYCVFAEVTEGMDVVDSIEQVTTGNSGGHGDVPVEPVVVEKAEIVDA